MPEKDYKDLEIWKSSIQLAKMIYGLTANFPSEEKFGLSSQLKRAAVSVPSNIAEGIARNSRKETKQFLYISKGSIYEIETQIYLAVELGLASPEGIIEIMEKLVLTRKLLIGFIKYLEKQEAQ